MGVYWGSRWVAVTSSLSDARVEMIDLRPGPTENGDQAAAMFPEHLQGCPAFESEAEAVKVVRAYVLEATRELILEFVVAIEIEKLEIERLRAIEPNGTYRQGNIEGGKKHIAEMTEQLKGLRALRRQKIAVV